jgi:chromosome segregation ATPase
MSHLFGTPNYGAASQHIAVLMREREDYEQAIRTQATRIQTLEADLAAANEQVEVQALISESRARQLAESQEQVQVLDLKLTKIRSASRLLWGLLQEMQMRVSEQQASVEAGNELLESLDNLLESPVPISVGANAAPRSPARSPFRSQSTGSP